MSRLFSPSTKPKISPADVVDADGAEDAEAYNGSFGRYRARVPLVRRAVLLALGVTPVLAWLVAITCAVTIGDAGALRNAVVTGPGLILAYALSELLLIGAGRAAGGRLILVREHHGTALQLAAAHVVAAWYGVVRLLDEPSVQLAAVTHVVLVYLALLAGALRALALAGVCGGSGSYRVAELETELREARVQYDAMCALLQRRHDDYDESDEPEGDEREHLIVPPFPITLTREALGVPARALPETLQGRRFDRALALKIAHRLRKRGYGLGAFYEDTRDAFPELQLYMTTRPRGSEHDDDEAPASGVTSGLGADDEYRRTIGALFAVYWLMRIGIDGERGFSFGVDDSWAPYEVEAVREMKAAAEKSSGVSQGDRSSYAGGRRASKELSTATTPTQLKEAAKRLAFFETQDWGRLQQLLIDSGMLTRDTTAAGGVAVVPERTVAMLALTAFHDVMKVEALLPVVEATHAPYLGFKAGDTINDHDLALGYVLDFHASLLPSFAELTVADQHTVRFTQSKMSFNHGWLVQGEAPPSPLFAKFKQVLLSDGASPSDVGFYFVHWLTDLAGAEPSPLGGAEKFVLKFPHAVLDSFIRSFAVLNDLAIHTETKVMEEYLVRTWAEVDALGPPPRDEDGIALMRLALQAQTPEKQQAIIAAYRTLPKEDQTILRNEMARTGIRGQAFERAPAFTDVKGPTFLVYYSPAFVRNYTPNHAPEALRLLTEVYRRARKLWPLARTSGDDHAVTIRIDQIKELKLDAIQAAFAKGNSWILCRKNDNEGVVEQHPLDHMAELMAQGIPATVLKFWRADKHESASGTASVAASSFAASRTAKKATFQDGLSSASGRESPVSDISPGTSPVPAEELQRRLSGVG